MERSIEAHASPTTDLREALDLHQKSKARFTRSIDINLDVPGAITSFFDGINAIFHFTSLRKVSQTVNNLLVKQTKLEEFTVEFANRITSLLTLIAQRQQEEVHSLASILTSYMVLDEATTAMEEITQAITPLLQGIIPTYVVTPADLIELFHLVKDSAKQKGWQLALASPNEILQLKPMTFQRDGAFEMLISLPVVDPKMEFNTYHLINLPVLRGHTPTIWDLPDMVFGLRPTLYPDSAEYISMNVMDMPRACDEYFTVLLCRIPTTTSPSCIADLYHNKSDHCLTTTLSQVPTLMRATQDLLFFFKEQTKALVQCDDGFVKVPVHGLVKIQDKAGCQLITDTFSYTFVGDAPSVLFNKTEPKLVDIGLMPDPQEDLEESGFHEDINDLKESLEAFNQTRETIPDLATDSFINYFAISICSITFLTVIGLTITFIMKAQGRLCCGNAGDYQHGAAGQ